MKYTVTIVAEADEDDEDRKAGDEVCTVRFSGEFLHLALAYALEGVDRFVIGGALQCTAEAVDEFAQSVLVSSLDRPFVAASRRFLKKRHERLQEIANEDEG